jgi:hypothetical protein
VEIPTVYTKIRFISTNEVPKLFKEHDGVTISGAAADVNGEKIIYAVGGSDEVQDYIVVVGLLEQAVTQTEGFVSISRTVPEMDYIVEANNRLWGCKYGMVGDKPSTRFTAAPLATSRTGGSIWGCPPTVGLHR